MFRIQEDDMELAAVSRSVDFASIAEATKAYMERHGRENIHTARAKKQDLEHWMIFLAEEKVQTPRDVRSIHVETFIATRRRLGEAPRTVNRRLATVKHWCSFIVWIDRGFINPCYGMKGVDIPRLKPKSISLKVGEAARAEISDPLNRVVFELMYRGGLRTDEVSRLTYGQLDLVSYYIRDVRRKAKRVMDIPLNDSMLAAIWAYLPVRKRVLIDKVPGFERAPNHDEYPLIVSARKATPGNPASFRMWAETIRRRVSPEARKHAGEGFVLHHLRHSFCSHLYDATRDLKLVQQAAGHKETRTTEIYTVKPDDEVAAEVRRLN